MDLPAGSMVDVVLADGTHQQYWSTHCRHGNHEACSATEILGELHVGPRDSYSGRYSTWQDRIPRESAQCKTCGAPCVCDCHKG